MFLFLFLLSLLFLSKYYICLFFLFFFCHFRFLFFYFFRYLCNINNFLLCFIQIFLIFRTITFLIKTLFCLKRYIYIKLLCVFFFVIFFCFLFLMNRIFFSKCNFHRINQFLVFFKIKLFESIRFFVFWYENLIYIEKSFNLLLLFLYIHKNFWICWIKLNRFINFYF